MMIHSEQHPTRSGVIFQEKERFIVGYLWQKGNVIE
jgi:hypothetical protein